MTTSAGPSGELVFMMLVGLSKGLQRGLLVFLDVQELVEFGDLEDLVKVLVDVAKGELAPGRLDLFVQREQLSQRGAGEKFDVAEVQEDFFAAEVFDEAEEVFADFLDVLFVEDAFVDEVDDRDFAIVLDLE